MGLWADGSIGARGYICKHVCRGALLQNRDGSLRTDFLVLVSFGTIILHHGENLQYIACGVRSHGISALSPTLFPSRFANHKSRPGLSSSATTQE
jgi:hypothetical protein